MTDSRTDTAPAPEPFANPARTDTELISPSRVPAEQGAGSREQEKNLSDSTIHPTTSTSTRNPATMDGTTISHYPGPYMCPACDGTGIERGELNDGRIYDADCPTCDGTGIQNPDDQTPTDQRPVAPVVARDQVAELRDALAYGMRVYEAEADRRAAVETELSRTEGDLSVAIREANHHRGLVAKVAGLHVDDGEGFCGACRTEAWPCATATAIAAALAGPGAQQAGIVDVDNPFRREVRPRRGTEALGAGT